jgi:DNA (cytosine-5)-methyltransferase 1
MSLTLGSLFSGIGGLELGLERAGIGPTLWQVEQEPYALAVLEKHWPSARRYTDVRAVGAGVLEPVDVICGGFPCQDISGANPNGRGLDGERSGLWFEFRRIVEEMRPRAVVVENVSRLVRRGLDVVVSGLDELGYAVDGVRMQAADVGAPHRRERLFLVAVRRDVAAADRTRREQPRRGGWSGGAGAALAVDGGEGVAVTPGLGLALPRPEWDGAGRAAPNGCGEGGRGWPVANPHSEGQPQPGRPLALVGGRAVDGGEGLGDAHGSRLEVRGLESAGRGPAAVGTDRGHPDRAPEPRMGRAADGLPGRLDGAVWPAGRGAPQHPWEPPRTAKGVPHRAARLKALGNAVVPACAEVVGWRVRQLLEAP